MDVPQDDVARILTPLGFAVESDGPRARRLDASSVPELPRRRDARNRSHRRSRPALRVRPAAGHVPGARDAAAGARRPDRRAIAPSGGCSAPPASPKSMTFAFIERQAALPFCDAGGRAGRDRQSAVGEVRGAAAVAAAGSVDACVHNRRRERRDVRLFETGSRFTADGEGRAAAFAWCGAAAGPHWSAPTRAGRLLRRERASSKRWPAASGLDVEFAPVERPFLVAGRAAEARVIVGRRCARPARSASSASCCRRSPKRAASPRAKQIYVGEIDLDLVVGRRCGPRRSSRRVAAAVPVDRARHLDPRRRSLACCCRSWHYPFGSPRHARLDRRVRSVSGQGRAGRSNQPVACASRSARRIAR